ncbi:unnamed protein product [Schistosoma rodhaini]|uniref:E2F-associated phosphoprotein n=1 Tax=Schistosoma rodhaini TaxID=6188 RepID=A0AA85FJH8_9TREM|nr:unnamed protein product [Schistosoma rodhaini]
MPNFYCIALDAHMRSNKLVNNFFGYNGVQFDFLYKTVRRFDKCSPQIMMVVSPIVVHPVIRVMTTEVSTRSAHQKATDSKTERKQNENLRVRFKKDHDDDGDFPVDKDPLCDYEEDEANAKWVQENLPGGKSKKSDAILNCPGCMSVLSLVSHRHPHFKTQYYTEHPINCLLDETQIITRTISKPHNAKKSSENSLESNRNVTKEYHPVTCKVCGNSVGCKEIQTNVIYFNDVLASHS